jgi:hypothetical protein
VQNLPAPSHVKKIIEYGWDVPTAQFVRENIREMEKRPFDGIVFWIWEVRPFAFGIEAWSIDDMKLDTLAQIEWEKFTDNFLLLWLGNQPGREMNQVMDWYNDTHWQTISANMRLYAMAAQTADCVGIVIDPEPYGINPWLYSEELYPGKSFEEVAAKVRQRGAQWLSAIQDEFPNPRILSFFFMDIIRDLCNDDPENLPGISYALLPAFLEGMLDVASPATRIIDGGERAYYYDETNKFFNRHPWIMDLPPGFLSPENHAKYAERLEMGMALYVDNVLVEPIFGDVTFPEAFRKTWWRHNVYYALSTADEYVWCYSEEMDWWADDIIPGTEEGIVSSTAKYHQGLPLGFDLYKNPEDYWNWDVAGTVILAPTVSITGPPHGTTLTAPAMITIQATATGENIERIEFYVNSRKYGEFRGDSVSHTWTDLPSGNYTFLARVFDTEGGHGTSGSLHVAVVEGPTGVHTPSQNCRGSHRPDC